MAEQSPFELVEELQPLLDQITGYNENHFAMHEKLATMTQHQSNLLRRLFADASCTMECGKYVVACEMHGATRKVYVINNAFGAVNPDHFNSNQLKAFHLVTQDGLNYIELTKPPRGRGAVKALVIHFTKVNMYNYSGTVIGDNPLDNGDGHHYIRDVFNTMQTKALDEVTWDLGTVPDDALEPGVDEEFVRQIIRGGVYMLSTGFQTSGNNDSLFLNPRNPKDDSLALHRRNVAFYSDGNSTGDAIFVNFRNHLTLKNKTHNESTASLNNISACFKVNGNNVKSLRSISMQTSMGYTVELASA